MQNSFHVNLVSIEYFSASHHLYHHGYDREWNEKTYGKCSRKNGHGHNYVLEVHIQGSVNPETGMVLNLNDLKAILNEIIIQKVDHYHLNYDVPFLNGIIPTSENVALAFWRELEPYFPNGLLHRLKLWETKEYCVEIIKS